MYLPSSNRLEFRRQKILFEKNPIYILYTSMHIIREGLNAELPQQSQLVELFACCRGQLHDSSSSTISYTAVCRFLSSLENGNAENKRGLVGASFVASCRFATSWLYHPVCTAASTCCVLEHSLHPMILAGELLRLDVKEAARVSCFCDPAIAPKKITKNVFTCI